MFMTAKNPYLPYILHVIMFLTYVPETYNKIFFLPPAANPVLDIFSDAEQ